MPADAADGREPVAAVARGSPRCRVTGRPPGTRCGAADAPGPGGAGTAQGWSPHLRLHARDVTVLHPRVASRPLNSPVGRDVPWRGDRGALAEPARELQALTAKV